MMLMTDEDGDDKLVSKDRCSAPGAEASPPHTPACFVTLCPELAQCNIAGCSSSPNKLTGAKHKNVRQHN